jgi:hypothetical protein
LQSFKVVEIDGRRPAVGADQERIVVAQETA